MSDEDESAIIAEQRGAGLTLIGGLNLLATAGLAAVVALKERRPLVQLDDLVAQLRNLRGSRGLKRAKTELLDYARKACRPDTVKGLLITNFVVQ